jgi:hypothetical protein
MSSQTPTEIRRALFRAQAARCLWLYRKSVADRNPNGWHLLRVVQLSRDFGQPIPNAVRDALAAGIDAMMAGTDAAEALRLKDRRGGSPKDHADAAAQRARYLRWLELYLPERLGGVPNGADERFSTAEQAYAACAQRFGLSARTIKTAWLDYQRSRTG